MNVGCRRVELVDGETGTAIPTLAMYPTDAPERAEQLGPFVVDAAMDGPVAGGRFPLVVISHGSGGSHLVYRDLAAHLARSGMVVVMLEHPRNNRNNNDLAGTAANLADRPRHLCLAIERALSPDAFGAHLHPDAVAVVGHSMGGYTALAVAGGLATAFGHESPDGEPRAVPVSRDPRVKALVLLAPAAAWFMAPGALDAVRLPILMLTAELDEHAPAGHARIIRQGLSDTSRLEHRVVPNAGHFSFLSPFPAAMTHPGFPPSQDPAGFDRSRFHEEMHPEIEAFLRRVL